ncbi:MAG TPA: hypothetical protein VGX23_25575 [Actinocrinis sp.]|nr:hypothetical protein [Actinocrinis sp.]
MKALKSAAAIAAVMVLLCADPASARVNSNDINLFAYGPTYNYIAEYSVALAKWTVIGSGGNALYVGDAGVFESMVPDEGPIYEYNGTPNQWTEIGGPGAQFAVGGDHLYGLSPTSNYVAEWNGPGLGWTTIGGPALMLFAGRGGLYAIDPTRTNLYRYDGTPNQWTYLGSGRGDFAVSDTTIYSVPADDNTQDQVEQWVGPGDTWLPIGGSAAAIWAGGTGVYLSEAFGDNNVEKYSGTPGQWTEIGGPGAGFFSSGSEFYGLGPNGSFVGMYSGHGQTWTQIGGPAEWLAAGD